MHGGFRNWLEARGLDQKTITTQLSQAGRLENHFGDLDTAFDTDCFQRVRSSLRYSKKDERAGRSNPAPFSIEGDLYSNLASYRTTLNYYSAFRESPEIGSGTRLPASKMGEGDGEETPPIDINESDLKRLVSRAKERGYVTYRELNDALPQDASSEQIEDMVSAISEMGIKVVEEAAHEAPSLDRSALERMRSTFLERFPDFEKTGFRATASRYWEVERGYKQVLIDKAAEIMAARRTRPGKGSDLLGLLEPELSNLLDWRELQRLHKIKAESSLISEATAMLAFSSAEPAVAVADFVQQVWPTYSLTQAGAKPYADMRVIPTMILALVHPTRAIAVRYQPFQTAGRALLHKPLFRNGPLSRDEYQRVLDMAAAIEAIMRTEWRWDPRDLWDVQGFIWTVHYRGDRPAPEQEQEQEQESGKERQIDGGYRTQTDVPAWVDALERGPFASVLAARIVEVRGNERDEGPDGDRAFMVHLHGPWGSGKSSVLNLLRHELEHPKEGKPSLVVLFNAWKQQRMRPPWWALMSAIYRAGMRHYAHSDDEQERWGERLRLWRLWWSWRWKAEGLPLVLVATLLAGLAIALLGAETRGFVETLGKIGVAAAAALAGVYAYARLMIFGSQKAVQTYADLTTDPYRRIVDLFNRLVAEIKPPLIVFVDDLDRCDSAYVVELLEGIQTLFRNAPVAYVVAADRKWICSSFEKKYSDFAETIGEPGRPLGYLFLDKLFQISAEMPRLTADIQASYLAGLLRERSSETTEIAPAVMAAAEARVSGISNEADLQQLIADEEAQVVPAEEQDESVHRRRALRVAAALQITSVSAAAETEHRLQKLAHLLEPNPRSMKRLVNAVGMAQARGILEGRTAAPETRARWAMLSLRWPVLAEFIADNPEVIRHWQKPKKSSTRRTRAAPDPSWPQAVQRLHGNIAVIDVVGGEGEDGSLTQESLTTLLA
jgi:hypothetical protein